MKGRKKIIIIILLGFMFISPIYAKTIVDDFDENQTINTNWDDAMNSIKKESGQKDSQIEEKIQNEKIKNIFFTIVGCVLLLYSFKYIKIIINEKLFKKVYKVDVVDKTNKIPNYNTTPAEIVFINNTFKNKKDNIDIAKIITVTIINLIYKGYLKIEEHPEGNNNLYIIIKRIDRKEIEQEKINLLERHEKLIYDVLLDMTNINNNKINIENIPDIVENDKSKYRKIINSIEANMEFIQENKENYSKDNENKKNSLLFKQVVFGFIFFLMYFLAIFLKREFLWFIMVPCALNYILIEIIIRRLELLTFKGKSEYIMWKKYENYLNEISEEENNEFNIDYIEKTLIYSEALGDFEIVKNEFEKKYKNEISNLELYMGTFIYYIYKYNTSTNLITLLEQDIKKSI